MPESWVRGLAVAASVAVVVAVAIGLGLWIGQWHALGWTGLAYFGEGADPEATAGMPESFRARPGRVQAVYPRSPAERAGLAAGDHVVAVAGAPVTDGEAVARAVGTPRRGDALVVEVAPRDGGPPRSVELVLASPFESASLIVALTSSLAVALVFLVIGTLVAVARPRQRSARIFYLLGLVAALFFTCWAFAEIGMRGRQGTLPFEQQLGSVLLFCAFFVLLSVATGNLLLHLALVFPRPRPIVERRPQVIAWLHSAPFLPAVGLMALFGGAVAADRWGWGVALAALPAALLLAVPLARAVARRGAAGWIERPFVVQALALVVAASAGTILPHVPETVVAVLFGVAFVGLFLCYLIVLPLAFAVLTLVALVRGYRASGVEEKRQLRWPLWGTGTALLGSALLMLVVGVAAQLAPEAMSAGWISDAVNMAVRLLYLLIPVSFAFAVAKYRLMDIDLVLRKTAVYGALTLFVLVAYLGMAGIAGMGVTQLAGVEDQTATVVLTLALAALLVPARNRVQALVDRRFGRRPADRARLLADLGREALAAGRLEPALERFAEAVQQTLQSRAVVVFAAGAEGGDLAAAAKVGVADERAGRLRLAPGELPPPGRRVAPVDQAPLADATRARFRRLRIEALAVARRGGEPIGAVAAGRPLGGEELDAADLGFLADAADQLSLVLGTLAPRREAAELSQAGEIQRALLPSRLPELPGVALAGLWRPAREVAGDYYDVIPFPAGRAGLCIADVVGKGMPAALVMSGLQGAVRAVAGPDVPPERVTAEVRRVLTPSLSGGRFVTFFYGLLDAPRRRLTYTNAGHLPPLLVRADGSLVRLAEGGGAIARLLANAPLVAGAVDLLPGDRLLLFTDGVTEARPPAGELYGEERLAALVRADRLLGAEALAARVADDVRAFAGGELEDDVTLLVATVG